MNIKHQISIHGVLLYDFGHLQTILYIELHTSRRLNSVARSK